MANGEYGDIGLRVRQRREELGLTREKMAERAGLWLPLNLASRA